MRSPREPGAGSLLRDPPACRDEVDDVTRVRHRATLSRRPATARPSLADAVLSERSRRRRPFADRGVQLGGEPFQHLVSRGIDPTLVLCMQISIHHEDRHRPRTPASPQLTYSVLSWRKPRRQPPARARCSTPSRGRRFASEVRRGAEPAGSQFTRLGMAQPIERRPRRVASHGRGLPVAAAGCEGRQHPAPELRSPTLTASSATTVASGCRPDLVRCVRPCQ